jgi:polyisoprenoid-binding protein YceI
MTEGNFISRSFDFNKLEKEHEMKTVRQSILSGVSVLALAVSANAAKYEAGTYQVDSTHSKIGFEIPHLVISTVDGKFDQSEGTLDLNENFEKSKVKASVDIGSIDTGLEKRDTHLKSPDFFDAAKYPKMTFESTSIAGSTDSFKLTGNLTIKGVTKKVTFDGKYLGTVADGFGNQKAAFTAKTKINRKDFGLNWNSMIEAGPVVGDQVTIDLRLETGRPLAKKVTATK